MLLFKLDGFQWVSRPARTLITHPLSPRKRRMPNGEVIQSNADSQAIERLFKTQLRTGMTNKINQRTILANTE